jgi:kynurenine formamidase
MHADASLHFIKFDVYVNYCKIKKSVQRCTVVSISFQCFEINLQVHTRLVQKQSHFSILVAIKMQSYKTAV